MLHNSESFRVKAFVSKSDHDAQAGLAASQTAFASYHQLQNETQLYAINMQFSGGQVQALRAQRLMCQRPGTGAPLLVSRLLQVQGDVASHSTLVNSDMANSSELSGAGLERQDQQSLPPHAEPHRRGSADSWQLCDSAVGRPKRRHHSRGPLPLCAFRVLHSGAPAITAEIPYSSVPFACFVWVRLACSYIPMGLWCGESVGSKRGSYIP